MIEHAAARHSIMPYQVIHGYTSSGHRLGMPILCSRLRHVHVLLHHRPGRCLGFRDGDAAMLHVQVGHELPGEVFVYMLLPETNGVSLEAEIPEVVVLDSMAELLQLQLTALDTF